jgi:DNA-binding NarL/FixJ family response regulator
MDLLVVEESEAMWRLIRKVICAPSWRCHECSDGSQALTAYARHRPDWVLLDVEMKAADGIAIAAQICAAFPGAKIVILTSYDDADLRQAAREAGACGYVLKENLFEVRRLLRAAME